METSASMLRAWMEQAVCSQRQLGQYLGVSQPLVSRMLAGRQRVSLRLLLPLSELTGIGAHVWLEADERVFGGRRPKRAPVRPWVYDAELFIVPPPIPPAPESAPLPEPEPSPPEPETARELPWTRPALPSWLARELTIQNAVDQALRCPLGHGVYVRPDAGHVARCPTMDECEAVFHPRLAKSLLRIAQRRRLVRMRQAMADAQHWR